MSPDFCFAFLPTRRVWSFILAAVAAATFAGCETTDVPADDIYQPPAAGAKAATLRGSSIKEGGLFGSEHRGFVSMIDLKTIPDASDHWDQALTLSPGKRNITAEYKYSNFMSRAYMSFEAMAGVNYQLMIKNTRDASANGLMYNDFWIVDLATGKSVTPIFHRQVSGGKKGTIFYQTK